MSAPSSTPPSNDNDNDNDNDGDSTMLVAWTGIWVTAAVSIAQGVVFYLVFLHQRGKDRKRWLDGTERQESVNAAAEGATASAARTNTNTNTNTNRAFDMYESRQHTRSYRSPPPFGIKREENNASSQPRQSKQSQSPSQSHSKWFSAAWNVSEEETLRCVGLDAYMFLRVVRIGARVTGFGSLLSLILMPVYATGAERGLDTELFNRITLARVEQGIISANITNATMTDSIDATNTTTTTTMMDSIDAAHWRLYLTVACWYAFCCFILYELHAEWKRYAHHRASFVARGDLDTPIAARYAVRVEQVALEHNTDRHLLHYFERLFPQKVFQATSVVVTDRLEQLIVQRKNYILKLEAVVAKQQARSSNNSNSSSNDITITAQRGQPKVSAVRHYESEIERLNGLIDQLRRDILTTMGHGVNTTGTSNSNRRTGGTYNTAPGPNKPGDDSIEVNITMSDVGPSSSTLSASEGRTDNPSLSLRTTTAFVTFKSLCAKQAALQCALTDNPDKMVVFPAFDPASTLWNNAHVPLPHQTYLATVANALFTIGILFWAVPVSFVLLFSNLNTLLDQAFGTTVNEKAAWYGLVAGLLPVILLAILMMVLFTIITMAATKFIRYKSGPEVDSYCLFWHMLFQFANLWLIVIGGSLIEGVETISLESMAKKMTRQAVFFINMILVSSFGAFGLELSMIPKHAVTWIMGLLSPEAARTQRQLDNRQKPPSIVWGQIMPPIVFIFLVSVVYMPIAPVLEIFSFAYFTGMYMVWKHQCLHVYAQEFEGGGDATWQQVFVFLMACLYVGEVLFIGFMGMKAAPIHAGLGFVPLILTVVFHRYLVRKVIVPLRYLSLEVAADVDLQDGELNTAGSANTTPLFRQPVLDPDQDERVPLPYRRKLANTPSLPMGTSV